MYSFGKRYIKKKFLLFIFITFSIILAIIGILIPYVTENFIDFLVYLKNKNDLINYCIFYAAICILSIVINFIISRISLIIVKKSVFNLQMNIINSRENSYILNVNCNSKCHKNKNIKQI